MSFPNQIFYWLKKRISYLFEYLVTQTAQIVIKRRLRDPFLIIAISIGIIYAVPGFRWGEYDCLNLDAMAFNNVFSGDRRPFEPSSYVKPPFYTYMCHFAARVPAMTLANIYFFKERHERFELFLRLRTSFARCLNMAFFALCTTALFVLASSFYSLFTARIVSIIFATSCCFIPYQIFLTTDLPVIFMMLTSFLFAVKILNNPPAKPHAAIVPIAYSALIIPRSLPRCDLMNLLSCITFVITSPAFLVASCNFLILKHFYD